VGHMTLRIASIDSSGSSFSLCFEFSL